VEQNYISVEHTFIQQYHQQSTVVTGCGLLRTSSDRASMEIKIWF